MTETTNSRKGDRSLLIDPSCNSREAGEEEEEEGEGEGVAGLSIRWFTARFRIHARGPGIFH